VIEIRGKGKAKWKGVYLRNPAVEMIHLLKRMTIELKKIQFLSHQVSTALVAPLEG